MPAIKFHVNAILPAQVLTPGVRQLFDRPRAFEKQSGRAPKQAYPWDGCWRRKRSLARHFSCARRLLRQLPVCFSLWTVATWPSMRAAALSHLKMKQREGPGIIFPNRKSEWVLSGSYLPNKTHFNRCESTECYFVPAASSTVICT